MTRRERLLALAVIFVSVALIAAGLGILMLWSRVKTNHAAVRHLEGQVVALGAIPVTKQPAAVTTPPTTMIPPPSVPFPPSTLTPTTNRPSPTPTLASPVTEPSTATTTTSTTASPTTTTTVSPTLPAVPCVTVPLVGVCVTTKASRGTARTEPNWAALRQCESGGDYSTNTGNGYYGAYQFSADTWHGLGYDGLPSDAAPDVQNDAARLLYAQRGPQPWPVCGRFL